MAGTTGWVEECHPERWNGAEDRTGAGQDRQWASQWTVPGWREVAGVCPPQGPHCPIFSHLLPSRISLSPFFTFQLSLRSIPTTLLRLLCPNLLMTDKFHGLSCFPPPFEALLSFSGTSPSPSSLQGSSCP